MATENYIYLLRTREFVTANQNVYKIGRTNQTHTNRFKQYPKGSELILQYSCKDCIACEKGLLYIFRVNYIKRKDIGSEYFEGDVISMKRDIHNFIDNEQDNVINTNELIKAADEKAKLEKRAEKEELAKQAKLELEKQLELEKTAELAKQEEINKEVELARQAELAKQEELDKEVKLKIQEQLEIQLNKQSKITELYKKENQIKLKNNQVITSQNLENILKPEIFCERCGMDFKSRKTLIRHLEKDVECVCLVMLLDKNY